MKSGFLYQIVMLSILTFSIATVICFLRLRLTKELPSLMQFTTVFIFVQLSRLMVSKNRSVTRVAF